MKYEGLLPCSEVPATCPCSVPDLSSPRRPSWFLWASFKCYPPIYAYVFQLVCFSAPHPTPNLICVFPLTLHTHRSFRGSGLITRIIPDEKQNHEFLNVQSPPVPVTSYLLHKNIFLITLFPNILSLSTSQNVQDLFSYPYKTTGRVKQMGRQKTIVRTVEGISGVQSALNFFTNAAVTC